MLLTYGTAAPNPVKKSVWSQTWLDLPKRAGARTEIRYNPSIYVNCLTALGSDAVSWRVSACLLPVEED